MPLPLAGFLGSSFFAGFLGAVAVSTILRVAAAVGFSVITFAGITTAWDAVSDNITSQINSLSASLVSLLELFGIMFGIHMILATVSGIIAIKFALGMRRAIFKG